MEITNYWGLGVNWCRARESQLSSVQVRSTTFNRWMRRG